MSRPVLIRLGPPAHYSSGTRKRGWFLCLCGEPFLADMTHVKRGLIRSCGCLHRSLARERLITHGDSVGGRVAPEYTAWANMISRCHNPRNRSYARYGGRGITVCSEWRNNYEAFLAHIGRRPPDKTSIDRIDFTKGYEPGNVRWATAIEQARNTRRNIFVEHEGERLCLEDYCQRTGRKINTVRYRLNRLRWPLSKALEVVDGRK